MVYFYHGVEINNAPKYAIRRERPYMVAKKVGNEWWYWDSYISMESAERAADGLENIGFRVTVLHVTEE